MSGEDPVCPCCGAPCLAGFPPRLLGRTFVAPEGWVELTTYQKATVAVFLAGSHDLEQTADALGISHRNRRTAARERIFQANQMLRIKGWGIARTGETYELKRRSGA